MIRNKHFVSVEETTVGLEAHTEPSYSDGDSYYYNDDDANNVASAMKEIEIEINSLPTEDQDNIEEAIKYEIVDGDLATTTNSLNAEHEIIKEAISNEAVYADITEQPDTDSSEYIYDDHYDEYSYDPMPALEAYEDYADEVEIEHVHEHENEHNEVEEHTEIDQLLGSEEVLNDNYTQYHNEDYKNNYKNELSEDENNYEHELSANENEEAYEITTEESNDITSEVPFEINENLETPRRSEKTPSSKNQALSHDQFKPEVSTKSKLYIAESLKTSSAAKFQFHIGILFATLIMLH